MNSKVYIILFLLSIFSFKVSSQEYTVTDTIPDSIDCIVLRNNFIIKGEIKRWVQGGLLTKKKAIIITPDGTKWDYFIRNIAYMRYKGYIVKPLPLRPQSKDNNMYFMIRIMNKENYSIYKYEKIIYSDYGEVYDWKYYLYHNKEFLENINNKNYKQILQKYFDDCDYIQEIVDSRKNYFWDDKLSKIAVNYKKNCK